MMNVKVVIHMPDLRHRVVGKRDFASRRGGQFDCQLPEGLGQAPVWRQPQVQDSRNISKSIRHRTGHGRHPTHEYAIVGSGQSWCQCDGRLYGEAPESQWVVLPPIQCQRNGRAAYPGSLQSSPGFGSRWRDGPGIKPVRQERDRDGQDAGGTYRLRLTREPHVPSR